MQAIRWAGYAAIALAGIVVIVAINLKQPIFVAAAVAACLAGVLLLAVDRALVLLSDIRDALVPAGKDGQAARVRVHLAEAAPLMDVQTQMKPVRTAAEIAADLERLKAKH